MRGLHHNAQQYHPQNGLMTREALQQVLDHVLELVSEDELMFFDEASSPSSRVSNN
jgi:hypothetical protein